jgi:N-acetylglutamate synthase-like GNAT family acetyltransferase
MGGRYVVLQEEIKISVVTSATEREDLKQFLLNIFGEAPWLSKDISETINVRGPSIELVARKNAKIVGGLIASWKSPVEVDVRMIGVDLSWRRNGIGTTLIKQLKNVVKTVGCSAIRISASSNTVEFFRHQDFSELSGNAEEGAEISNLGDTFKQMEYKCM